jgi:hypothetical protein
MRTSGSYTSLAVHAGKARGVVFLLLINLVVGQPSAHADVIYTWRTLSATLYGVPTTSFTAFGEITLTDAAVASGVASVTTSNPEFGLPSETLDGVASASFRFTIGPGISTPTGVIDFTTTPDGQYLNVVPINSYGGFFVNEMDTEAYYALNSGGADTLTIGYGSDNIGNLCYGPQNPWTSHCVVTGEFQYSGGPSTPAVDEPGALLIFGSALCLLAVFLRRWRSEQLAA